MSDASLGNRDWRFTETPYNSITPGLTVRIVSLATLFAMKREANRPKDLTDIDGLSLLHGLPSSYDDPGRS